MNYFVGVRPSLRFLSCPCVLLRTKVGWRPLPPFRPSIVYVELYTKAVIACVCAVSPSFPFSPFAPLFFCLVPLLLVVVVVAVVLVVSFYFFPILRRRRRSQHDGRGDSDPSNQHQVHWCKVVSHRSKIEARHFRLSKHGTGRSTRCRISQDFCLPEWSMATKRRS